MLKALFSLSGILILKWIYGDLYEEKCKFPDGLLSFITVILFVVLVILFASKDSTTTEYIIGALIIVLYIALFFVWRAIVRKKYAAEFLAIENKKNTDN